ncbi:MAG TPA: hypothetical protein VGK20_12235 [Candidatus Binatia bacterium]|jgi:hypothetical protein
MKTVKLASVVLAGIAVGFLVQQTPKGFADETVTTTTKTTTYSGVVSEIDPNASTIILKSESAPAPVTYKYTKETTFVDSNGNAVSYETVRNAPVTIEYAPGEGGQMIVRKVIETGPPVAVPATPMMHRETTTHTESTH